MVIFAMRASRFSALEGVYMPVVLPTVTGTRANVARVDGTTPCVARRKRDGRE